MAYRDDLEALEARKTALDAQLAATAHERDGVASMLDEVRRRASLPILDNIRVASPCSVPWASMAGDDRVRHCDHCDQRVYNISEMTRDEATALLQSTEGRLCARFFRRADGTILTSDCPVGVRRRRRRLAVVIGGTAALLATGVAACAHRASARAPDRETSGMVSRDSQFVAGEVAYTPAPPPVDAPPAPPSKPAP